MQENQQEVITATLIPNECGFEFFQKNFPTFFVSYETYLFHFMNLMIEDYMGGSYLFYELSNGAAYSKLDDEGMVKVTMPLKGMTYEMSIEAASLVVNAVTQCLLMEKTGHQDDDVQRYHRLLGYIREHPECDVMLSALD